MANPTSQWDKVPIFGWYMELDGSTPKVGQIKLTLGQRVNTQSSFHTTFPGGTVTATIGDTTRTDLVNQIRAAMSAVDQAAVEAAGGTFDAAAWGAVWDAKLPSAFFTDFPASDDPDIIGQGYEVKVEEKLTSGDGKIYYITPTLSDLLKPIPGVNLGEVDVPPGSPTAPAPIYQKGVPGGVAPLDDAGLVPTENLPASIAGAGSWTTLTDKPAVIAAGDTQQAARTAIGAGTSDLTVGTTATDAKPGDWKPTAADISDASTVGQSLVKATDAATARTVIGAGTSSVVLGTTAGTAADASTVVPVTRTVNAKPLTGDIALDAADVDARPVNWFPTAADISDASTVGKALVKAVDAVTARTAIGAGTSNLVLGTVAGTAADGAATAAALTTSLKNRGVYASDTVYAINDVVVSPGYGLWAALQNHTSAGNAPTSENPYWTQLAGASSLALGTDATTAKPGDWEPAAADISDAGAQGQVALKADTVAALRAAVKIYELPAGGTDADAAAAGVPDKSWVLIPPVLASTFPTLVGYSTTNVTATGVTTVTVTPDSTCTTGMTVFLAYMAATNVTPATPAGFELVNAKAVVGTRTVAIFKKTREASDGAYTLTQLSSVNGAQLTAFWLSGANSTLQVGAGALRADNATATTCKAPSLTTTGTNVRVLVLSFEATIPAPTSVVSVTGATQWFFAPEAASPQVHTLSVSTVDMPTAGATGDVTIQYDAASSSAANGYAIQIGVAAA